MLEKVVHRLNGSSLQIERLVIDQHPDAIAKIRRHTFVSGIHSQMKPTPVYVSIAYIKKTPHPMSVIM
jgi:hypothetical protein